MIYTIQFKNEDGEYQLHCSLLNTDRALVIREIEYAFETSQETVLHGNPYIFVTVFDDQGNEMMCAIDNSVKGVIDSLGLLK